MCVCVRACVHACMCVCVSVTSCSGLLDCYHCEILACFWQIAYFSSKWNGEGTGWFLYKIPTFIILCKGNTALEQARCDLKYSLCFSTHMWWCLRPFNHRLKHFHTLFNSSFKMTSIYLYKQWVLFTKKIIVRLPKAMPEFIFTLRINWPWELCNTISH